MSACSGDADRRADGALSCSSTGTSQESPPGKPCCPNPRADRAFLDDASGELIPIPCGRNSCPYCRGRNVQITAAMMGLNASRTDAPPRYAVLSTTREWVDDGTLREGWAQFARRVRREVHPDARYAWFREWTTGKRDGVRRTHYHSIWSHVEDGEAVASISHEVWGRIAGAYSEHAHGAQRVWDAGGLARYVAGLAGHHLKSGQAPPPGWTGRRFGTSRGYYADDPRELRKEATSMVRDDRLRAHLERVLADELPDPGDGPLLPLDVFDELLTARLEEARKRPPLRVARIRSNTWASS
jgi:hypothetical protein